MRALVTGAAGFIGSHLCERLIIDGHEVVGIDAFTDYYPRKDKEANLSGLLAQPRFTLYELDLRTDPLGEVLQGIDAVIHEAAMPGLERSWRDIEGYSSCNVVATQRLAEASCAAGVSRFVQASTSSVYGRFAVGDETMPTRPVSPYGVTKLAAEHLLLAYHDTFGLPVVVLRYFSVYGPRQRPDMAYRVFVDALLDGRPITIFGDGRQVRSNTHVSDCVEGTILALEGGEPGQVYNLGGNEKIGLIDALAILAAALDVDPVLRYQPARPGDQRETLADCTKARERFGYAPDVPAAEGLRGLANWCGRERETMELMHRSVRSPRSPSTAGS